MSLIGTCITYTYAMRMRPIAIYCYSMGMCIINANFLRSIVLCIMWLTRTIIAAITSIIKTSTSIALIKYIRCCRTSTKCTGYINIATACAMVMTSRTTNTTTMVMRRYFPYRFMLFVSTYIQLSMVAYYYAIHSNQYYQS